MAALRVDIGSHQEEHAKIDDSRIDRPSLHELPHPDPRPRDAGYATRSIPRAPLATSLAPPSAAPWFAWAILAAGGLLAGPIAALYWRATRDHLLDHPKRRAAYDDVLANPGTTLTNIARRLGAPRSATLHHVEALAHFGFIRAIRQGNRSLYFGTGVDAGPEARSRASALATERAQKIADYMRKRPTASSFEIARATAIPPSTVRFHRQRLQRDGVVPHWLRDRRDSIGKELRAKVAKPMARA